jgi:hypothetical protein
MRRQCFSGPSPGVFNHGSHGSDIRPLLFKPSTEDRKASEGRGSPESLRFLCDLLFKLGSENRKVWCGLLLGHQPCPSVQSVVKFSRFWEWLLPESDEIKPARKLTKSFILFRPAGCALQNQLARRLQIGAHIPLP